MGIFKKVGGRIIDVRVDKWMSWDYLGETADRFKILFLDIVIPKKANTVETFEEAMRRLELTESDLIERQKEFTRLCYFFIFLAMTVVIYALYTAFMGSMVASLISFCLALYALTQAFRFHFWLFQIKNKKLGCSIKEWMNSEVVHTASSDLTVKNKDSVSKQEAQKKAK
ncbi:MAG: type IVB secretion system protein IcmV [Proteobacteria bacterium]|nr:type IVB secretion system protein IcmV [Pseudomonadota bacterium]